MTLRSALIAGWNANTDLDAAIDTLGDKTKDVFCLGGWYNGKIVTPQLTITEVTDLDTPFQLGYGVIRVLSTFQIDIWVKVKEATEKGPGLARKYVWQMRQEVKRILKANLTGLTDLQLVVLDQTGRNLDEHDQTPPLLRYSKQFGVIYEIN